VSRILIAGCGDVGTQLGLQLVEAGHRVWGLRREPITLPAVLSPIAADLTEVSGLAGLPEGLDFVFYTAAAGTSSEVAYRAVYVDGLRNLLQALEAGGQTPRRFFFTSATSVYGQQQGEWVDETSLTEPNHFSGQRLLEGEQLLGESPFATTVLRLGGIYGPGRDRLIEAVRRGTPCTDSPPLFTNRIHRDDCAGALCHLLHLNAPAELYLGVDHEPAAQCTVMRWLAEHLGVPLPKAQAVADIPTRGNKRCRNTRLIEAGYRFRYPTFREGYAAMLAD
jgi:nucleoside-diphosphate-sugar epimerase